MAAARTYFTTLCLVVWCLAASTASAIDLGTFGKTYSINEPDFLDEIQAIANKKLDDGEWNRLMLDARKRALGWLNNPTPVAGLRTVTRNRRLKFDPSVTLTRNLYDGYGRLLYPAGTRVNPADIVGFDEELLLLDGEDPAQLKVAESQMARWGQTLKIILVNGSPARLMDKWRKRVYFDQDGALVKHFHLHAVPDLIYQASPSDRFLTVEEIKP